MFGYVMANSDELKIKEYKNAIEVYASNRPKSISMIDTQPYPGFPTDLQNQILAMQTISRGTSVIVENLYESRLKICNELAKMGANKKSVPMIIRGFNVFLFILAITIVFKHITYNGLDITNTNKHMILYYLIEKLQKQKEVSHEN